MKNWLSLIVLLLMVTGCATKQAYEGEKLSRTEVAVIYEAEPQTLEDGKLYLYIKAVDEMEVGNYSKGYPSYVEVLPGKRQIKVHRYLHNIKNSLPLALGSVLGGAFGGAIAGSSNANKSFGDTFIANVDKGQSYIVSFKSLDGTSENIELFVESYDSDN